MRRVLATVMLGLVLVVAGCGDDGGETADDGGDTPTTEAPSTTVAEDGAASDYESVTDVSGQLTVEVPTEWSDHDLTPAGLDQSVRAAPALADFGNGGPGIGVTRAVFDEGPDPETIIDNLVTALDQGGIDVPPSSCTPRDPHDLLDNPDFEGIVLPYECASGGAWLFVGARPVDTDNKYGLGMYAYVTDDAEVDHVDHAIETVQYENP